MRTANDTALIIVDLSPMILNLFDGEGGGGAAPAGNGTDSGGVPAGAPALKRRNSGGEFANVIFGKMPSAQGIVTEGTDRPSDAGKADAEAQTTSNTLEERKAQYRSFKEGEYKDLFDEDVQRIIGKRVRENKALQEQIDGYKPVLDLLTQRYGVAEGDMKALAEKLENDNAYWSEAAEEAGMSVEQYKQMQKLERENRQLLEAQRRQQGESAAQRQLQTWYKDADALKAKFPSFSLENEVLNRDFMGLLRSGVPMEHAYKVVHMDELVQNAMTTTAAATEQKITANVRAKGARPAEAGTAAQGGVVVKSDVSKLSKAERAEIARRALAGETISF